MRCPICGTKNENNAVECVACGSALTTSTSETQSEKTTTQKKNSSNKNSNKNKKTGKNTQQNTEQVSTEENVHDPAAEQGVIPSVVIIGKEKEHIPMNIEYDLASEKYLEEEEDDEEEEALWGNQNKKPVKPLISASDTAVYVCMGILGFLLVFAISYLAINILLQDMGNETQPSTTVGVEDTTESGSSEEETSTTVDETEQSSSEESSSETESESTYDKGPWVWDDTYRVEIIDGEVYLLDYVGEEEIVRIPAEFDGYPLVMIDANAFVGCSTVQAIEVPSGVTQIGDYAFAECSNLKVIALPDSLENIGDCAFEGVDEELTVICLGESYAFRKMVLEAGYDWEYGESLPEDVSQWIEEETTTEEITTEPTTEEPTTEAPSISDVPPTSDFVQATFPAEGTYTTEDYYEPEWIFRVLTLADGSQEAVIVRYRGAGGVVTVPAEYNGVPVRYLGKAAFQNQGKAELQKPEVVTELIIPDSVVYIEYHALADMQGCSSITIPSSVTFIFGNALEEMGATVIKVQAGSYAHAYCNEHPELTYQVQ